MEIMYTTDNNSYFNKRPFTGFYGELYDIKTLINDLKIYNLNINKKVKSYISKDEEYLSNLKLSNNILNKKISELGKYEYLCILLLKTILLKPKMIILNNIDLQLCEKYKRKFINFIRLVNATYNIKFIIISSDLTFINIITKQIVIMKNHIVKYQGNILEAIKSGFLPKNEIIEFIDYVNYTKEAKLSYTLEIKELLKDIYRSVF